MYLVMLGPPGAGKGTQAKNLSSDLGIPHISTGDIFRDQIQKRTPLGIKVKEIIDRGNLVDDETTEAIVEQRLKQEDVEPGFILDGFPRNIGQASWLDNFLKQEGMGLDAVLNLTVPDDVIVRRLSARRSCKACGKIFNMVTSPPCVENVCDLCGGGLVQRDDDREEVIRRRLEVYKEETEPLLKYYSAQGSLKEVDGTLAPAVVLGELEKVLEVRA